MADRALTKDEIILLESQNCTAELWKNVSVHERFSPGRNFRNVRFSGMVRLGKGFSAPAGISNADLHNVSIGDNCRIDRATLINVDVSEHAVIEHVGRISRTGETGFGNLSRAHVLAEDGGRSVPLWRHLTAQMAHLLCHCKNHPAARALERLMEKDVGTMRVSRSIIGADCRIRRAGTLHNVWIGPGTRIEGVSRLEDCYIDSTQDAPVRLGDTVEAEECVFLQQSAVSGGVQLARCLVGEGASLSGGFCGKHSLFFANTEFALGEADAVMAGPFATSSHKATLVLACQTSFSTFGSGSNASNHHFKLGPRHGGALRRGVKCGSGSYLFWPCDIGAFTTVVGRHRRHMDTAIFPFSLLLAENEQSVLAPGVNIFSAGIFRDERKWRDRDRREEIARPRDLVNPAVFSPYVMQSMDAGREALRNAAGKNADMHHGGVTIPAKRIEPALALYENALAFYLGERLLRRAARGKNGAPSEYDILHCIERGACGDGKTTGGEWRDWCGMLLSGNAAAAILHELEQGALADADAVNERLRTVHEAYDEAEWRWLAERWVREYGTPNNETIRRFIARWRDAVQFRHARFMKDAAKEFSPEAWIGYGLEENAETAFRRVRGTLEEHPLVREAMAEKDRLLDLAGAISAV